MLPIGRDTELSATDACAAEGRAGDTFDVGCPTQLVQKSKDGQANVRFTPEADIPAREATEVVKFR